METSQS